MKTVIVSIDQVRKHPAVASARSMKGYINIDVKSRPNFQGGLPVFKGEGTSRVRLQGDKLVVRRGTGGISREWESNLIALAEWLGSRGIKMVAGAFPMPRSTVSFDRQQEGSAKPREALCHASSTSRP